MTHAGTNDLCTNVEVAHRLETDEELLLGPLLPLSDAGRRRLATSTRARNEGTLLNKGTKFLVNQLHYLAHGGVEDDLRLGGDVEVEGHFSRGHASAVGDPDTLGLDGCAGLILDLMSAGFAN